jgi:DegV family protein with EDD domain
VRLKIVTDSTCDLPEHYYDEYGIEVVPVSIQFGNESYLDGITIDRPTFYRKIGETGIIPKTSQPSPGQFVEVYRALAHQGYDTVLSLHISQALSGIVNAARLAAEEVTKEIRVIPFDSLSGSAAMGFMCVEAAQMARVGKSLDDILARLNAVKTQARITLTLATLRYAQMSGRVSAIESLVASLLDIKPIVVVQQGHLVLAGRFRSRQAAVNRIVTMTLETAGQMPIKLAVLHAEASGDAEALMARLRPSLNCVDAFVGDLTTSIAVHFGPGAIGTVVYPV